MANLKITIEKVEDEKHFTVKVRITNDVGIESIIESMKEMFEIEMFSAEIKKGKTHSSVTIQTENEGKCEIIKKGMAKTFRQRSGLDNINNN
jgi:uncharacterized protein YggU (UPF0235/DUF167 family)